MIGFIWVNDKPRLLYQGGIFWHPANDNAADFTTRLLIESQQVLTEHAAFLKLMAFELRQTTKLHEIMELADRLIAQSITLDNAQKFSVEMSKIMED